MKLRIVVSLSLLGIVALIYWVGIAPQVGPLPRPLPVPSPPQATAPDQADQAPLLSQSAAPTPTSPSPSPTVESSVVGSAPNPPTAWQPSPAGREFAAFADWVARYRQAAAGAKPALEAEGKVVARARLTALANLIQTNPEQALQQAVPQPVRELLPDAIQPLLEEPVNTRGDFEVYCVLPVDGQPATPMVRVATINGEQYRVFTYDQGLEQVTRPNVPLNGIAVPAAAATTPPAAPSSNPTHLMAMAPSPVRYLNSDELAAYLATQATEPRCTVTGQPCSANGEPAALQFGGTIYPFSSLALATEWAADTINGEALDVPVAPDNLPTGANTYTEGRKRFMVFRVDFPDYEGEVMTTNDALSLMLNFSNFMAEVSYDNLIVAPVGEGSDITPTMRLPNNAESYASMGTFLNACWTEATARGYDKSQYDFWFVCTAGKPNASFAGLGYVGGVGFWLANRYWNVRTCAHEYGHNLGLSHANWWNTGGHSMLGDGSSEEYGDPFDTMGSSGGGIRHFSSYNKNKIDWIPDRDCPTVTQSGRFRIYAHDMGAPVGLRGLRFDRPSGGDYWVEFRQLWTSYKALMNGVSLRWVGGSTTLLDFTPGSSAGKDDHPITIGRTFTDTNLNLNLTPIGTGHTHPESMDVVVNIGTFPGNRPPTLVAHASALAAGAGQTLTFTADAADADGDTLAYFWDFGDGDYSVDNQAATTHSFGSQGEYVAQCTVSDMKGGQASESVIVRVDTPTTYSIHGHVLQTNGLPLVGIKVSVNSSHYAFTESDGSYTITGLGAGNYVVTPIEPVYGQLIFLPAFWDNPIVVPTSITADFIARLDSSAVYTPLLARESEWKYLDDGSDQGTNWRMPAFDDSSWASGRGILGYPADDVRTELHYGTDPGNKFITYYFRKTINLPDAATYTNLLAEIVHDDGVILYLNGIEAYRDNLPSGTVTASTLANTAISGGDETTYFAANLDASLLVPGTNVLAVEIHQAQPDSSDIGFDLGLSGLSISNSVGMNLAYITYPEKNQTFTTPVSRLINATAISQNSPVTQVDFYDNNVLLGTDPIGPGTPTSGACPRKGRIPCTLWRRWRAVCN